MPLDANPIIDILYRTTAKYLQIRPDGVVIADELRRTFRGRILATGAARTLYRGKRPRCRSLDAQRSLDGKRCAACRDLSQCTSQVRVHMLVDANPYQLLLAYTSAKNYLLFCDRTAADGRAVTDVRIQVTVINRGNWGELRFEVDAGQAVEEATHA